jgi:hypothetical protein
LQIILTVVLVDRAHTAIHGHLKALCDEQNITFSEQNVKVQDIWCKLKVEHLKFNIDVREQERPINQTVIAIGNFLESMNKLDMVFLTPMRTL